MPRKKSIKRAAIDFAQVADEIFDFFKGTACLNQQFQNWCAEYAIIRLYTEFEVMMLKALTGAIKNNSSTISETLGFSFPKHLSEDVCRYLIIGTGYFDFKGRDGLIKILKDYVPDSHYLLGAIKDPKYKDALEQLSALRNYAAHQSNKSKKAAKLACGGERFSTSGSWLRKKDRFEVISDSLKALAKDIEKGAPY